MMSWSEIKKKKKVLNAKQRTLHLVVEEEGEQLSARDPQQEKREGLSRTLKARARNRDTPL